MFNLSATLMVKNESECIYITLQSIVDFGITILFVLDTGSTDNTIKIIKAFSKKYNITLHLFESPFIDFAKSRNQLLKYVNKHAKKDSYTILLDAKDEIRKKRLFDENSFQHAIEHCNENEVYFLKRHFDIKHNLSEQLSLTLIKLPTTWRYQYPVHEYLINSKVETPVTEIKVLPDIYIYQKRNEFDSKKRNEWDKTVLHKLLLKSPHDKRAIYYLAQTYFSLGDYTSSFKYYKERAQLQHKNKTQTQREERYDSILCCTRIGFKLKLKFHTELLPWVTLALEEDPDRAEPYIYLAAWYNDHGNKKLAKFYIDEACKKEYPQLIIPFNRFMYDTFRWELERKINN